VSNDSLAFDAYDRLVGRHSMAASPVSVVVRGLDVSEWPFVIERCQTLLAGRRQPDEIVLGFAKEPPNRPPSSLGRLHVRTVVHPEISDRDGLEWLIANARWPVAVFVDPQAELPASAFRNMLEALDHADVVIGRRRSVKGARRPSAAILRRLFGVATSDPLTPYLAIRRTMAAGIPLTMQEPLARFELLAKLTFAFAMYDEVDVDLPSDDEPVHRTLRSHWRDLVELYRRPRFWPKSGVGGGVKTTPQETRPPTVADSSPQIPRPTAHSHPLRGPSILEQPSRLLRR
jgi:hypothetical protein